MFARPHRIKMLGTEKHEAITVTLQIRFLKCLSVATVENTQLNVTELVFFRIQDSYITYEAICCYHHTMSFTASTAQ